MSNIHPDSPKTVLYGRRHQPTSPRARDVVMRNRISQDSVKLTLEEALSCVAYATQAITTYIMTRTSNEQVDNVRYPPVRKAYFALAQAHMHLQYIVGRAKGWTNFGHATLTPAAIALIRADSAIVLASAEAAYMHFMPRLAGVVAAIADNHPEEARKRVTELIWLVRMLKEHLVPKSVDNYYTDKFVLKAILPMRVPVPAGLSYPGYYTSQQDEDDLLIDAAQGDE